MLGAFLLSELRKGIFDTVGTAFVPKISSATYYRNLKITKHIGFQWFFAVRSVGISQAKHVFVGTTTLNQNKNRKEKL